MEYGWAGSGSYLTSPVIALSTELTALASSSGDTLAVSAPFANSQGAVWADIEFIAGGTCSPGTDAFLEVWILRSLDGGLTFEDGSASVAPARGPDATIEINEGTAITPHALYPGVMLPPGTFKVALRNQTGVALPASSVVRFAVYSEGTGADSAILPGDASGTTALRIADMMERFGVVTYSQSAAGTNPWGAGVSDYTTSSVIAALTWLTANSGMTCNLREYHVAGRDTGAGSNQLSWCPTVASATGSKFSVSLLRGAVSADATSLSAMAVSSADGTGWMTWAEGLNTPNDGSITAANCVAVQQALYSGVSATRTKSYPVAVAGPSYTYNTLPPETSTAISTYLTAPQKVDLLASSSLASVRFFPTLDPEADDSAGRGGNADDVALGHGVYFGKPLIMGEWHPTSGNTDSPSHAIDDSFGAFYAALGMLNFHRLGYEAWFWKSLFDIGQSGDSPFTRVGLFPNSGSGTPRLPARTIRAMYALTGDTGSKKRTFRPSKLDYTITGLQAPGSNATPWTGGHHRLYQNSGGTFFLFVWNEQRPILGTGSTITISFIRTLAQVVHYDLTTDATTAETPVATLTNIATLSFSLTASVHLLVIYPQGSTIPTESAQGTTLTAATGAIIDAAGVSYSLIANPPSGFQVNHGGITDSSNVVLLLYWDHVVWQQTSTGTWSYWSGSAWVAGTDPRIVASESPDGLSITGTGTTIYASQIPGSVAGATLDQWTITAGAQMALAGIADGSTSNVIEAYYHNHIVYMRRTDGNAYGTPGWWQWSGSAWNACPSPKGLAESAEGTVLNSVGPTINASQTPGQTSATLDIWALVVDATYGGFAARRNGAWDGSTAGLLQLYYHNHTVYQQSTFGNSFATPGWWSWTGSGWAETADPTSSLETTDRTYVTTVGTVINASQTPGSPAGIALDQWAIDANAQLTLNGSVDPDTAGIIAIYYASHYLYQQSSFGNALGDTPGWWRWTGSGWEDVHDPRSVGSAIVVTNIPQVIEGQNFGVNGTLSGYTSPPSLQYRDGAGTWAALPSGAIVSATSFSFTHPAMSISSAAAPAPAAAVGYTMRTAGPFVSISGGTQNWFPVPGSNIVDNGNGSVTDIGGVPNGFNHHCTAVDTTSGGTIRGVMFKGGGYYEMTLSFPGDASDQAGGNGWPAFWLNGAESTGNYSFSFLSTFPGGEHVEYDAAEWGKGAPDRYGAGIINWDRPGGTYSNLDSGQSGNINIANVNFNNRHRYGFLHVPATASSQGYVKNYFDGQQVGDTYVWNQHTSAGQPPFSIMDSQHHLFIFGTGTDHPFTVYAFEAWQANDSQNIRGSVALPSQVGGGSGSTSSVSVRDAGNTTVQATSNTFTIIPSGSMALTGITLSGTTVVAGSGAGTPVGSIAVQATGGTFSGTLAVNDTTHFSIGANNTLLAATLAVGNYPISITATQSGASASPLVRAFTISAMASSNTSVNFAAPTGKTVNKTLFGVSSSFYGDQSGNGGTFFENATFRNTANTWLKPALLAFNADWDLDYLFSIGDMTRINNLINNYKSFCQSDVRVVMGCCIHPDISPSTRATNAANFATYLNNNGHSNIMDWQVGILWDRNPGWPQSTVIQYFNAVADALHGVNPNYRVWGPAQWDPGAFANATFGNQVGSARCQGVKWVSYDVVGTNRNITDSLDICYGAKGVNNPDAINQRNALAGTPLANVALGTFDYNMCETAEIETAVQSGRYMGGIYAMCYLYGLFRSTNNVTACALQNIVQYGSNGCIGSDQQGSSLTGVSCTGYLMGKFGQSFFGPEYTVNSTIANMAIWAVKPSATTFAIALINYDLTNARTVNLSVSAGGVPTGTISRWEIGKSSPGAPISPTPVISTQPSLSTISIASETVVILTGNLA